MLPIERPQKIICVGLNYRDHAEEQGGDLPERPLLFAKWPNTLIGPGDPIVLPLDLDEGRLRGGARGRHRLARSRGVSVENALEAVAGYICVNDVSGRDLQFADGQWVRGKSLDTFCPVGPALVPASEIPDPQALGIRAILNGEVMQDSTTANMVFGVAEIVAFISQAITLEPGDLIATGTPAGRRRLPRPAGVAEAGRRDHDRDRRHRRADEPRHRRNEEEIAMAFVLVAKWTAKEGQGDARQDALERLAVPSRDEPGCRFYQPCRDPENPDAFLIFEIYDDQAAFEAHGASRALPGDRRRRRVRSAREPRADVLRDDLSRTSPARAAREPFLPMLALRSLAERLRAGAMCRPVEP